MPHFMCTVCNRRRPEPIVEGNGVVHESFGWVCLDCLHHYTFEALRMIANLNTCSSCSVRGTDLDGGRYGRKNDWYCDLCTYQTPEIKG
jgi:hypothetical protein